MKAVERTLFPKRKKKGFGVKKVRSHEKFSIPSGVIKEQINKKKDSLASAIDPNLIHYHWYVFEEPSFTEAPTTPSPSSSTPHSHSDQYLYNLKPFTNQEVLTQPETVSNVAPLKQSSFISTYPSLPSSGYGYGYGIQRPTKFKPYLPSHDDFGWNYSLEQIEEPKKPLRIQKLFQSLGPVLFPLPFILAMIPFLIPLIPLTIMAHLSHQPLNDPLPDSQSSNAIIAMPPVSSSEAPLYTMPPVPNDSNDATNSSSTTVTNVPPTQSPTQNMTTTTSSTSSAPGFPNFPNFPIFPGIPRRNQSTNRSTKKPTRIILSSILHHSQQQTANPVITMHATTEMMTTTEPAEPSKMKEENVDSDFKKILSSLNFPQIPYDTIKVLLPDLMLNYPLIYLNDTFDNSYDRKNQKFNIFKFK